MAGLTFDGPPQRGQGQNGQYVYWLCMACPSEETVAAQGIKAPSDFTRDTFREACVAAHAHCGVDVVETICFLEPHADGRPHLNLLVRCDYQYRWLPIAKRLLEHDRIHVGFGRNIKTWLEGVVYGTVASEHKPPEGLDREYKQWHKAGTPTPVDQVVPRRQQGEGFVRTVRMTHLAFYDACAKYNLRTEEQAWAKATELDTQGDRALLSYLMENDSRAALGKVAKAAASKEKLRRAALTREQLLEEFVSQKTCSCSDPGRCYGLLKQVLQANSLDGTFQREVLGALRAGRAKQRNICLLGPPDSGKSFLLKGLRGLFEVYERPDSGSHQLEDLLTAEIVFLNDFEYDSKAPEWMPWGFFKDFLEGSAVKVAVPKQRGGNAVFEGDAPVFLTCESEVTLKRYNREVKGETAQMRKRIKYLVLTVEIPAEHRQEVKRVCPHCSARLYLEGKAFLDGPQGGAPAGGAPAPAPARAAPGPGAAAAPASETEGPAAKKARLAADCVAKLKEAKTLLDVGALEQAEFDRLKADLLGGL